jgi:BirA family biotin operon repressor/biotin-[acetyl-CoA-carboxylase] ligase
MRVLDAQQLRDALGPCIIGREIVVLEETTSTNDSILHRAASGAVEGLVVFAEHQTAGRGQRQNVWESAAHNGLWFSILLQPKIDIADSPRLSRWAIDTVAKTIEREFGLAATIKPPNDVYVGDKKVAGVLVEMRAQQNAPHLAVVGIGINVNQRVEDFSEELRSRAASLAMLLIRSATGRIHRGEQVDRAGFALALLRELDRTYQKCFNAQ